MFKKKSVFLPLLLLFCQTASASTPVQVVTSIGYLKDLTENILCQNHTAQISSIVQTGADPHDFALTFSDRSSIEKADVLIALGNGLDPWAEKIPNKKNHSVVFVAKGQYSQDPHIWQSPEKTQKSVQLIADGLIKTRLFPEQEIRSCEKSYLAKLDKTVLNLKQKIHQIPAHNRVIATNHDSLFYFAKEFDFQLVTLLSSNDNEQPSPKQIKNMIHVIRSTNARALFLESTGNMKNMEMVSKETGVKIGGQLFGDSLGPKGSKADTTLGMWEANVDTLIKALQP